MTRFFTAAAACGLVLLAGCQSSPATTGSAITAPTSTAASATPATPAQTPTAAAPTPTAAATTPSPTPTPTARPLALGESITAGTGLTITVLETKRVEMPYSEPVRAVLVSACLAATAPTTAGKVTLSWQPWALAADDGSRWPANNSFYSPTNDPRYPMAGEVLAPGECAKGWIQFPDAAGATKIRYSNQAGHMGNWTLNP